MNPFVLYCKSYSVDVLRVVRLARTIRQFNEDQIPFYVSAPRSDLPLFQEKLTGLDVQLIADEDITAANPAIDRQKLALLSGNVSQQIVKSEFWRLGFAQSYLCLDSDCIFIRPFHRSEFITKALIPYTIVDEGRDILYPSLAKGKIHIPADFRREAEEVQRHMEREGKAYNFGANCPVWDRRVWESLNTEFLEPNRLSILDLIQLSPNEMRWYGEALLRYRAIDLLPSQPFFKMYHYAWQQRFDESVGIRGDQLRQLYCGVVYQSAWEREMDWPSEGGGWLSRLGRRLRRRLGRI